MPFPPTSFQPDWTSKLLLTNFIFSFPPKSFSPMLFVMTPINAVIPMMRVATVTKSIKSNHLQIPLCLSVFLLYEIKDKKERNVRKIMDLF